MGKNVIIKEYEKVQSRYCGHRMSKKVIFQPCVFLIPGIATKE